MQQTYKNIPYLLVAFERKHCLGRRQEEREEQLRNIGIEVLLWLD